MSKTFKERILSAFCAAAMLFSSVSSTLCPVFTAVAEDSIAAEDSVLSLTSIEVYPNGEGADEVVTLEGMMPEGAEAEVVDLSDEVSGIAAYDITITDGDEEFQPADGEPIYVEISDPDISGSDPIELWHIRDDGEREQITDFVAEDGKISFYATGFSVYQIVKPESGFDLFQILADYGDDGFDVSYVASDKSNAAGTPSRGGPFYLRNETMSFTDKNSSEDRIGIVSNKQGDKSNAAKLYFEEGGTANNQFYIYFKNDDGTKNYLEMYTGSFGSASRAGLRIAASSDDKTLFELEKHSSAEKFRIAATVGGKTFLVIRNGSDANNPMPVVGYELTNTEGDKGTVWMSLDEYAADSLNLNNKTYGLMNYTTGTHGYALMAGEDDRVHSLVQLITRKNTASATPNILYVDEGSEVAMWTFHSTESGNYKLSTDSGNGTEYLVMSGDVLTLTSSEDDATEFTITTGTDGKIRLSSGGKNVCLTNEQTSNGTVYDFEPGTSSGDDSWLYFVDFATISDDDFIKFSADRVSVSDVKTGDRVIVYIRIWDDVNKVYNMYAVDCDGTLFPCYASGGKILWLADGTCSLEWEFTEYLDKVTKQPNYYYELYNPYSEKYLAPQMQGSQVISDSTIGINMQGRRNGEFYSQIGAWDNTYYAYVGLTPNEDNTRLVPCALANSVDFYFATIEDLNLSDSLHTVKTVDNMEHGITVKMQDFPNRPAMSNFLGTDAGSAVQYTDAGILSTDIGKNGYPTVTRNGQSLAGLFNNTTIVNHLFIESVYNSSGYFEFDSCQNFASFYNIDGSLNPLYTETDSQGNEITMRDFTVFRELGTTDNNNGMTRRHGQFLPYDSIVGKPISKHKNTYKALTDPDGYSYYLGEDGEIHRGEKDSGALPDSDPRKYEEMYNVGNNPNYYNGMELEASFVQTVSGLDAWGHDMVFEFTGDDDFWLYVDGELIIDLGGIHSALEGNVNFRTGEVSVNHKTTTLKQVFIDNFTARYKAAHDGNEPSEQEISDYLLKYFQPDPSKPYGCEDIFADYSSHTMRIFYMERGAGASNLHMRFNLASVTPGHVVVSKSISGEGEQDLDKEFLEYPFQIYYTLPVDEEGNPGEEQLLKNDDEHTCVTYQNSNQSVRFVQLYRPPGFADDEGYENVYFLNPTKNAEIAFPDKTISYRLVECAVDDQVYSKVLINGVEVPADSTTHDLASYSSDLVTAENRPTITFDNVTNENIVRDLYIRKKLIDEDGREIFTDPTTFDFRLYLSSVPVATKDIPLANMQKYYVLSPDNKMCRFDHDKGRFVATDLDYSHEAVKALIAYCNDFDEDNEVYIQYNLNHISAPIESYGISDMTEITFLTSGFGAISKIPAGYTICVPGVPNGSVFKVTEDVKSGYGIMGYERKNGLLIENNITSEIASYQEYDGQPLNVGRIMQSVDPHMEVVNRKGYGLTVNKKWSDLELTTYHEKIYVAVYADGELVEGSVKQIESPSISAYYFWTSLKPNADGSPRTDFTGYEVREVELEADGELTVSDDGTVSGYTNVIPLNSGAEVSLYTVPTAEATPNRDPDRVETDPETGKETKYYRFDYCVSYATAADTGTSRTDTISNTRKNGIALRLFKWDSTDPLSGGVFTLKDSTGAVVGEFTSDSDGLIKMLYSFEPGAMYTLVQNSAPNGYVGLQKTLKFRVTDAGQPELFYADGTSPWGSEMTGVSYDSSWASGKNGSNGITAYIDVYNKPFNLKVMKMDSENPDLMLDSAHFALYKQSNTNINGYVKYKDPITGFEDMVTVDGVVDVCGGNSGRVINPGVNGAVFFLTETAAPLNYKKLDEDIIFRISPLGIPTLISSGQGELTETDDSYIFTLSVSNVKDNDKTTLAIDKRVEGAFGNRHKEFTFTVNISNAGEGTAFEWTKNGTKQTPMGTSATFTMKHCDRVVISLPVGAQVTVTEANEDYDTTFKLSGGDAEVRTSKTFTVDSATNLLVVNTLNGTVATGVASSFMTAAILMLAPVVPLGMLLYCKRRRRKWETV